MNREEGDGNDDDDEKRTPNWNGVGYSASGQRDKKSINAKQNE